MSNNDCNMNDSILSQHGDMSAMISHTPTLGSMKPFDDMPSFDLQDVHSMHGSMGFGSPMGKPLRVSLDDISMFHAPEPHHQPQDAYGYSGSGSDSDDSNTPREEFHGFFAPDYQPHAMPHPFVQESFPHMHPIHPQQMQMPVPEQPFFPQQQQPHAYGLAPTVASAVKVEDNHDQPRKQKRRKDKSARQGVRVSNRRKKRSNSDDSINSDNSTDSPTPIHNVSLPLPMDCNTDMPVKPKRSKRKQAVEAPSISPLPIPQLENVHIQQPDLQGLPQPVAMPFELLSQLPPEYVHEITEEKTRLMLEREERLKRKAELARNNRRRKKERMLELEGEVARLRGELERAKKQKTEHSQDGQPMPHSNQVQLAVRSLIDALHTEQKQINSSPRSSDSPRSPVSDSDNNSEAGPESPRRVENNIPSVENKVDDLMTLLARNAQSTEMHLDALPAALPPVLPLQFLQWAMTQNDKFYADPCGLWSSLFRQEIGVSEVQMDAILGMREEARKQPFIRDGQAALQEAWVKFNQLMRSQMAYTQHFAQLRNILTPQQLAKFCEWVERFGHVCVMINI